MKRAENWASLVLIRNSLAPSNKIASTLPVRGYSFTAHPRGLVTVTQLF